MTPEGVRPKLLALAALLLAGTAASAQSAQPAPAAQLEAAAAQAQSGRCAEALPSIEAALPRLQGRSRVAAQLVRISCLGELGRDREVPAIYSELAAAEPDNPTVRSLGIFVAAQQQDFTVAAERLSDLAERNPDALATVSGQLWRGIAQKLTEQRKLDVRDRAFVALARADWQPNDQPELGESIVQGAIESLVKSKALSEAETMLPRITLPGILMAMATERLYAPLWPQLEASLGPNSARAVDRFAAERLEMLARQPDDLVAKRDATRAFLMLGRYAEAAEVAGSVPIEDGMGEAGVSSIRLEAQALIALGQTERAIARMRSFATLDPARSPEVAAGMVSFAELLDEAGRPAEALEAARLAEARWSGALSAWGTAWLRRTEVCALSALGQRAEAQRLGDGLKARASDNEAAAIEGLLCAGRTDEAAAITVETLRTPEGASSLADQFQPEGAAWAPSPSRLRSLWRPLLARAEVRKAFDQRLRLLPRGFWPAREPRPIPRMAVPEGSVIA